MAITLRPAVAADGPAISAIQAEGLAGGHASFRETPVTWADFAAGYPVNLVAEAQGEILGWSAIAPQSNRCVYAGVGEVSTYVALRAAGQGLGKRLLGALIQQSEAQGYWSLNAQIFPENAGSLALHARLGFEVLGTRRGLGKMRYGPASGLWRDVVLMERRSTVAGID